MSVNRASLHEVRKGGTQGRWTFPWYGPSLVMKENQSSKFQFAVISLQFALREALEIVYPRKLETDE